MALFIFGLFFGTATQMQFNYDECKSVDFKEKTCKFEKKLHAYKK